MENSEIIVAGAAILDVLVRPASRKVFETGSWPAQEITMSVGGDGMNEAAVLTRLGKRVDFTGILGDDEAAGTIRRYCRENGIWDGHLKQRPEIPTGINVVLVEENGERSFLTNPEGSLRKLREEDIVLEPGPSAKIFNFASIFVFPLIGPEELEQLFRRARAKGLLVCADTTKRKRGERLEDLKEVWPLIDYLFPNEEEARLLAGGVKKENEAPLSDGTAGLDDADRIADRFLEAGVGCVVLKRGAKGCLVKSRHSRIEVPAVQGVRCLDTTGAGDAFAAGFLCGLLEGRSLEECGILANACGSLAVEAVGAVKGLESRRQVEERVRLLRRQMGKIE